MSTATVVKFPARVALVCSSCGADGEGSCNCGAPYVTPGERAADAIAKDPNKSDRAIAVEIGVGNKTVSRARKKTTVSSDTVEKRTGIDGKKRKPPSKHVKSNRQDKNIVVMTDEPCTDCNTAEEQWQRSVSNMAGEAISLPAYWTQQFGDWKHFEVTSELITLAKQASKMWTILAGQLVIRKKNRRK